MDVNTRIVLRIAGEVEVARGSVKRPSPERKKHCTFEDKCLPVPRFSESEKKSFGCIALEGEAEILLPLLRAGKEASADRGGDVPECLFHETIASR